MSFVAGGSMQIEVAVVLVWFLCPLFCANKNGAPMTECNSLEFQGVKYLYNSTYYYGKGHNDSAFL